MELGKLAEHGYSIKNKIDALEAEAKSLGEELKKIQEQIMLMMKESEMSSFKHALGTVVLTTRFTVKNPATPEDKQAFFGYLKDKGIFDDMVSVHSQRLNSWYKEEMEVAKTEGNFDFKIPGIGDPSSMEYLTFRKG